MPRHDPSLASGPRRRCISAQSSDESHDEDRNKITSPEGPAGWSTTSQTTPHDILVQELQQYRHSQS